MAISDKVSSVYAEALLGLAVEQGDPEAVEGELREVGAVLTGDETVWGFFRSPLIQSEVKMRVVDAQLKSQISELLYNFIGVVSHRRRLTHLPEIIEAYGDLLDQHLKRRRVDVKSAVAMSEAQIEALKASIEKYTGQSVIMTVSEDPALLGGLKIRTGDIMIDSSKQSQLANLRKILMQRKILGEDYYEN